MGAKKRTRCPHPQTPPRKQRQIGGIDPSAILPGRTRAQRKRLLPAQEASQSPGGGMEDNQDHPAPAGPDGPAFPTSPGGLAPSDSPGSLGPHAGPATASPDSPALPTGPDGLAPSSGPAGPNSPDGPTSPDGSVGDASHQNTPKDSASKFNPLDPKTYPELAKLRYNCDDEMGVSLDASTVRDKMKTSQDERALIIAKSILSDEAKSDLLGLEKNPSKLHIDYYINCWSPRKPIHDDDDDDDSVFNDLGDEFRLAASDTVKLRLRDWQSHPDETEAPHLLSDDMREWIRFGLDEDMGIGEECDVALFLCTARCSRVPGPGNHEVWQQVRQLQQVQLEPTGVVKIKPSLLFYDYAIYGLRPCHPGITTPEAFRRLVTSISKLSEGVIQVPWASLHDSVKSKLTKYSHRAEEMWDAGYKPCLSDAFIWHALDDHFFSSTRKDKEMFSSPLWAADNLIFEALQEDYRTWCDSREVSEGEPRVKDMGKMLQARHETWRAIGSRMITRIDGLRLSKDYVMMFVKKELEHLINFESSDLTDYTDDEYGLCALGSLAMGLCFFDHHCRVDDKNFYLVWNIEDILATSDDPLQPPIHRSGVFSGFPWVTKPPYRDASDYDYIRSLPEGVAKGLMDRMARMGAEHVRHPLTMPVVNIVEHPMFVYKGSCGELGLLRGISVECPMVITLTRDDGDAARKALADDKAEWEARLKA
ncbi:hypothetical protein RB595_000410 [Gaeumannomyces hyphopodioides]